MCFSAGASFTAAAVLGSIGIASLKKVSIRSQFMFAAIPMLFAIQQVSEGLLWLALSKPGYEGWLEPATYFFLLFAQFLWPIWIPTSMFLMEHNKPRKKWLGVTVVAGIMCSAILLYRLIFLHVHAEVRNHHIYYAIESPQILITLSSILYVIAIIVPVLILSVKGAKALGFILAISLMCTKMFYEAYLISVWCFFAATLSFIILLIMRKIQNEYAESEKNLQH
ncbi:MAG: DUF6629 family protein, partial [Bacteroidia bacterium]